MPLIASSCMRRMSRSSLRQSKKLKALSTTIDKSVSIDMPEINPGDLKVDTRSITGYENQCYDQGELIYGKLESNNNQAIPLKQVIVSVDRITDHLSRLEGKEEESKILHEYFHSQPVQAAIEAIAVHRTTADEEKKDVESPVIANGTTTHNAKNPTEPNIHVVSLFKREDSYLRMTSGEVSFVVSSSAEPRKKTTPSSSKVKHMRALFDYDPEDDIYVPCKELALKFQRGDILHVLSTEDENWWQAYREGDDHSQSLAGLIPSSSFHQQVVLYMDEIEKDEMPKCRTESRKKLQEVIRTLGRKSSKEVQRSADEPVGNSIGYHSDLLTYEEVVLHLARTDRKRPLVLCGPEGVGCLELRQQLLESDRDRLAGPVPYTTRPLRDGELDGIHYHFIPKQRFLDDSKVQAQNPFTKLSP
ncbi:variant SH3 domain protein [Teladorsagia circumcincta]|uniref:Variant SH3 domain protein n=1 Tax=Teladorsagia circumcincta TaxID=45464 RepID=A0A2G9UVL6_TELCI|nr:variant SH3 domain protein [Teladorsagia circumcincta]